MARNRSTDDQLAFGDHCLADMMEWRAKTTVDALPGVLSVAAMLTAHHLQPPRNFQTEPLTYPHGLYHALV